MDLGIGLGLPAFQEGLRLRACNSQGLWGSRAWIHGSGLRLGPGGFWSQRVLEITVFLVSVP